MNTRTRIPLDKVVFRKTNAHTGRWGSVASEGSTSKHLARGHVILDTSTPAASCSNGDRERRFIVLPGEATVNVGSQKIDLGQHDSIYMLRDSVFEILEQSTVNNAEFPGDVENRYPAAGRARVKTWVANDGKT